MLILQEFLQFPFEHGYRGTHSDFCWDHSTSLHQNRKKLLLENSRFYEMKNERINYLKNSFYLYTFFYKKLVYKKLVLRWPKS